MMKLVEVWAWFVSVVLKPEGSTAVLRLGCEPRELVGELSHHLEGPGSPREQQEEG